jgi:hypothetical protein
MPKQAYAKDVTLRTFPLCVTPCVVVGNTCVNPCGDSTLFIVVGNYCAAGFYVTHQGSTLLSFSIDLECSNKAVHRM